MKEIQLSQGKVALVDDEDFEYLNQWKWYAHYQFGSKSYSACRAGKKMSKIWMHREIMNPVAGLVVDHINHDTLDNRKQNLRNVTMRQNMMNRKSNNNTFGYKGVSLKRGSKKYSAEIQDKNKKIYLGSYDTPEDAAKAYDLAAKNIFGEFAYLNFVEGK